MPPLSITCFSSYYMMPLPLRVSKGMDGDSFTINIVVYVDIDANVNS